jgi:hypothetical protein
MSRLNRKLDLNVVLSQEQTDEIRESHLSQSMGAMKNSISKLDLQVEAAPAEKKEVEAVHRYVGTELAEVARDVYRENINPRKEKAEYQDKGPDTHARRVGERSIQRAIMGLRNGGNEGKTSMVGPNGSGNVGKYSPSADQGSGNATNNYDNYYALTTDMTLEEYEAYIEEKFHKPPSPAELQQKKKAGELKSVGSTTTPNYGVKEDVIKELKNLLLQLEDSDWQSIDAVMRQVAKDNFITPKELHKEFKAQHDGQIPDEWLKENRDVEMAGFVPLQELARLNPAGVIYNVTYMYRGGTQRQKFLVPHMEQPSQEEMEQYVRGFWPFARVVAFYPDTIENTQNNNFMIAVPPVTENYKFYVPEDWMTLSEEELEIYDIICEEEGEPLTAPEQQADGTYILLVSDHDTGEPKMISFGEAMSADEWNEKLKAAAAANQKRDKERGMKIHSTAGVKDLFSIGSKKKDVNEAAPFVAAGLGKAAGALTGRGIAKATAGQAAKGGLRKKASDYATRKGASMAQNKVTDMMTDKDTVSEEKKEGKKDACYKKVKARYDVWPSAYASGALVKCRQKGAKNWGNSSKND